MFMEPIPASWPLHQLLCRPHRQESHPRYESGPQAAPFSAPEYSQKSFLLELVLEEMLSAMSRVAEAEREQDRESWERACAELEREQDKESQGKTCEDGEGNG